MSQRCVVTGGAGVIGAELVRLLVERGDEVRVVDVLPRPDEMDGAVDYVQADLAVHGADAVAGFDPAVVYHLAATFERSVEVPEFWHDSAHNNVVASAQVLQGAMRSPRLERYVFASSYLIYDPSLYLFDEPVSVARSLDEADRIRPRNVCGAAKLLHEQEIALASQAETAGFTTIAARIYRVFGPSSRDVVSRWVRAAVRGEPIDVFGEESRFDYVYSADVADGLIRLAESDATGVVNLASGRARTVAEVVAALESHFPELEVRGRLPSDIYEGSEADTTRLRAITGWSPPTQLERGVADLVAHERENVERGTVSVRVQEPRSVSTLITSLSAKAHVPRAVRDGMRALNIDGTVWGGDLDPQAVAQYEVDRFWVMPRLDGIDGPTLAEECRSRGIGLLIPTRDGELEYFATHRDAFVAAGVFIPIGPVSSVALANDKLAFAGALRSAGVPAIATSPTPEDVGSDRLVVKERFGAGSAVIGVDVTPDEAVRLGGDMATPVFQPFVDGTEYSIDLYVDQNDVCLGALVRERTRVLHGESQITSVRDRADIGELAVRVVQELGVRGHAIVQVLDDGDELHVLECNSRVGGASSGAWLNGLRTVDAMLQEAAGESPTALVPRSRGSIVVRVPTDRILWT
ncbi:MAG: NAD-dependent epimerase/dehydratase family protein [Actinomycetota bacterium]